MRVFTFPRALGMLIALATAAVAWGETPRPPIEPPFAAIEQAALLEMAKARAEFMNGSEIGIKQVHFRQVFYEETLLPPDKPYERKPAYLLLVREQAGWGKADLWYVMVLRPEGETFVSLLTYAGGLDCSVSVKTVDLGAHKRFPNPEPQCTSVAFPYRDVLIEDTYSPNGTSMRRVLLFHYDEDLGYFRNVFDENLKSWTRFERPYELYESDFVIKEEDRPGLYDLIITTYWWLEEWEPACGFSGLTEADRAAAVKRGQLERVVSTIHWGDGKYEGGLQLPKDATPHRSQNKWWLPEMGPSGRGVSAGQEDVLTEEKE